LYDLFVAGEIREWLDEASDRLLDLVFDRPGVAALVLLAVVLVWIAGALTAYFVFTPSTRWTRGCSTRIDPGKVQLAVLVAPASRDHLVPAGSSLAARHPFPNTTLLDVPSGHVGMLARARSGRLLYGPVSDWIFDVASR
jgi:hypothetical protein